MKLAVSNRSLRWTAFVPVLLLLVHTAEAKGPSAAMTVAVTSVERTPVSQSVVATGNVVAWREIPVSTEASGLAVTQVVADEGTLVVEGQVLARLNDARIRAELIKQQAVILELEANLASAKSDLNRAKSVATGVITEQTIEQRETLVKTTEARLEAARAQLFDIQVRQRQAVILAPAAGMVSSRAVTIGQVVQVGTEMFRIIQDGRIEVDARVLESDLPAASVGQTVKIVGPTGRTEQGVVRVVSPIVDPKTRLGTVRIALDRDTQLKPGMFARVEVAVDTKLALTVPFKALVWRDAKAYVFRVSADSMVSLIEVKVGRGTAARVEVLDGLSRGDRVVSQGAGLLNNGDAVFVETVSFGSRTVR